MALALASVGLVIAPAYAQVTPPDLGVCDGVACNDAQTSLCSDAGFQINFLGVDPANFSNNGTATYHYQLCSPAAGVCNGTLRNGESCLENSFCQKKGPNEDPTATCSRTCAVDTFRGLSHFDITFPELGGTESCLSDKTQVSGTCSNGNFVLGDGSCFDGPTSQSFLAKCDNTSLNPGQCLTMDVTIAGELTNLGVGAAVVVDKEATTCTANCLAGPACDCGGGGGGEECLTRTRGFWGTHPHIATLYDPVTVCGKEIDGQDAGTCSTSEALCTSANDYKKNPNYLTLIAQLTAAKLNLKATAGLFSGAICSSYEFNGKSIQDIIAECETTDLCNPNAKDAHLSYCIAALDDFNNSQDTGFDVTPSPFDKPGPADVTQCQLARGNGKAIGVNLCQ